MKRRKILTAAGAAAGAALTGCGGGEELDSSGNSTVNSQIAAYVPSSLTTIAYPGQMQVEVVFSTTNRMTVTLATPNSSTTYVYDTLADKPTTVDKSHDLGFALWRASKFTDSFLVVHDHTNGTIQDVGRWSGDYPYLKYGEINDEEREFQWIVYSPRTGERLVIVRFFPLLPHQYDTSSSSRVTRISPSVRHNSNPALLHPELHTPATAVAVHHRASSHNHTDGVSIVSFPSNELNNGIRGYTPCYFDASAAEKPFVRRRIGRHMKRLSKQVASSTDSLEKKQNTIGNEILTLLGGKHLVQKMDELRDSAVESMKTSIHEGIDDIVNYCKQQLAGLLNSGLTSTNDRFLQQTVDNLNGGNANGIAISTLSAQFGCSLAYKPPSWPLFQPGLGFRISFGLANGSCIWQTPGIKTTSYSVSNWRNSGIKLSLVGIVKLFSLGKTVTIDVEVTVNLTFHNGKTRVDSIVIDPVLDIDTRTWVGNLLQDAVDEMVLAAGGNNMPRADTVTPSFAPTGALSRDSAFSHFTSEVNDFSDFSDDISTDSSISLPVEAAREDMQVVITNINKLKLTSGPRLYGILEASLLRFILVNKTTYDGSTFTAGYSYGTSVYAPGFKYIFGGGYQIKYDGKFANITGFIRMVNTVDVGIYNTTPQIRNALANRLGS